MNATFRLCEGRGLALCHSCHRFEDHHPTAGDGQHHLTPQLRSNQRCADWHPQPALAPRARPEPAARSAA